VQGGNANEESKKYDAERGAGGRGGENPKGLTSRSSSEEKKKRSPLDLPGRVAGEEQFPARGCTLHVRGVPPPSFRSPFCCLVVWLRPMWAGAREDGGRHGGERWLGGRVGAYNAALTEPPSGPSSLSSA